MIDGWIDMMDEWMDRQMETEGERKLAGIDGQKDRQIFRYYLLLFGLCLELFINLMLCDLGKRYKPCNSCSLSFPICKAEILIYIQSSSCREQWNIVCHMPDPLEVFKKGQFLAHNMGVHVPVKTFCKKNKQHEIPDPISEHTKIQSQHVNRSCI